MDHTKHMIQSMEDISNIAGLSSVSDEFLKDYDRYQSSVQELEAMLQGDDCSKDRRWVRDLTIDTLISSSFANAQAAIKRITLQKRIKFLAEIDYKILYLYECTKGYNDQGFGKSISPEIFYKLMGKIKHLEVLQSWLFGID